MDGLWSIVLFAGYCYCVRHSISSSIEAEQPTDSRWPPDHAKLGNLFLFIGSILFILHAMRMSLAHSTLDRKRHQEGRLEKHATLFARALLAGDVSSADYGQALARWVLCLVRSSQMLLEPCRRSWAASRDWSPEFVSIMAPQELEDLMDEPPAGRPLFSALRVAKVLAAATADGALHNHAAASLAEALDGVHAALVAMVQPGVSSLLSGGCLFCLDTTWLLMLPACFSQGELEIAGAVLLGSALLLLKSAASKAEHEAVTWSKSKPLRWTGTSALPDVADGTFGRVTQLLIRAHTAAKHQIAPADELLLPSRQLHGSAQGHASDDKRLRNGLYRPTVDEAGPFSRHWGGGDSGPWTSRGLFLAPPRPAPATDTAAFKHSRSSWPISCTTTLGRAGGAAGAGPFSAGSCIAWPKSPAIDVLAPPNVLSNPMYDVPDDAEGVADAAAVLQQRHNRFYSQGDADAYCLYEPDISLDGPLKQASVATETSSGGTTFSGDRPYKSVVQPFGGVRSSTGKAPGPFFSPQAAGLYRKPPLPSPKGKDGILAAQRRGVKMDNECRTQ